MAYLRLVAASALIGTCWMGQPSQAATQAECWRGTKLLNEASAELQRSIDHHSQAKTEATRCEMLDMTRKQVLQKIDSSAACYEYTPETAGSVIEKAKRDLRTVHSLMLTCPAKSTSGSDRSDQKCSRDGAMMTAAGAELKPAAENAKNDVCAFVGSARKFIAASLAFAESCKHQDQAKTAAIRASALDLRQSLNAKAKMHAKGCR